MEKGKGPGLIVMLTWHDRTVTDAKEIFLSCKDAPASKWGFKNVGLPGNQMRELAQLMKSFGKETFLEVVDPDPRHGASYVKLCDQCGISTLLGTKYAPETLSEANKAGVRYFPFVGKPVDGAIQGSIDEIVLETEFLQTEGVDGINLSLYRYTGDEKKLLRRIKERSDLPICVPGSISSPEQIRFLKENNIELFTIGGAFFEHKFADTFAGGVEAAAMILSE